MNFYQCRYHGQTHIPANELCEHRYCSPELMPVIIRFDGVQEGLGITDNLCFTFMSSFIGPDGRDYFKTSWIGIASLLRTGVDLNNVKIIERG